MLYSEVTIENSIKMMLRCKLIIAARAIFIEVFQHIQKYQAVAKETRTMLGAKDKYKLIVKELNDLKLQCGRMYNAAEKV